MSITKKVAAVGLLGNVALIGGILYKRQQHVEEEEQARIKWESARNDSELECFFTSKQYFDQCRDEPDDEKECSRLAEALDQCKKNVGSMLPTFLPAMRPSILQYKV